MTDQRDRTCDNLQNAVGKHEGGTPRAAESRNAVWTERMLALLEKGIEGGVWYSLIDKVWSENTLYAAFEQVRRNQGAAGCDHVTVEMFAEHLESNIAKLSKQLRENKYRPTAIKRKWIPKGDGGKRPLGIPTVRDRTVQAAVRMAIEPIFEKEFHDNSVGFRSGRGCKDALRKVDKLLKEGYHWVVDADIKGYFDNIDHKKMMARVRERVADGRLLKLLESFLKQKVVEDMTEWEVEKGTPQGAVISPLLANIFLNPLDHLINGNDGVEMVRYADDFVILCRDEGTAREMLSRVQKWTEESGLELHPEKTKLVSIADKDGFDFLGYHFQLCRKGIRRWVSDKSIKRVKQKIKIKTRRQNGRSLKAIIGSLNVTLKGWFAYFKHSHGTSLSTVDMFTRTRLRSIIRVRKKRRGMSRGRERFEITNKYFAKCGLFTLTTAYARLCQSVRR